MKAIILVYCEHYGWLPSVTHNGTIVYKGSYQPTCFEAFAKAEEVADRIEVQA